MTYSGIILSYTDSVGQLYQTHEMSLLEELLQDDLDFKIFNILGNKSIRSVSSFGSWKLDSSSRTTWKYQSFGYLYFCFQNCRWTLWPGTLRRLPISVLIFMKIKVKAGTVNDYIFGFRNYASVIVIFHQRTVSHSPFVNGLSY